MKKPSPLFPSSLRDGNSKSFTNNHYYSRNGRRKCGCISNILRRILCISSLSSSPFDQIKDDEKEKNSLVEGSSNGTPNVVARLMGLDSLPRIESFVQNRPSLESVKKSIRSPKVMRYRKINPTFHDLGDENFFILSFDHDDQENEDGIEFELSERKSRKKEKRRRKKLLENGNKENEEDSKDNIEYGKNVGNQKHWECKKSRNALLPLENLSEKSHSTRKNRKKMVKQEDRISKIKLENSGSGSENSSPNSVLEFVEYPMDHEETPTSGNGISRLANTKMRRTLSEVLKSFEKPEEEENELIKEKCGEEENKNKIRVSKKRKKKTYFAEEKLREVGKLAAIDMAKMSWLEDEFSKNRHNFKEIGRDLASEILDQLIDELLISFRN